MRVDFYHLTTTPVERALPQIAEKAYGAGKALAVVADDDALLAQLDEALWSFRADSFLPHGRSGDQPILLCAPDQARDHAFIALADGVWRDTALAHERAFYFFDSTSIEGARAAWRGLAEAAAVERHYWKQDEEGR